MQPCTCRQTRTPPATRPLPTHPQTIDFPLRGGALRLAGARRRSGRSPHLMIRNRCRHARSVPRGGGRLQGKRVETGGVEEGRASRLTSNSSSVGEARHLWVSARASPSPSPLPRNSFFSSPQRPSLFSFLTSSFLSFPFLLKVVRHKSYLM